MVVAWRIVKRKHAKKAFTSEGARLFGGRWNSPGVAMVYTAESQSLAALEIAVHLESADLLEKYVVFEVGIDDRLISRLDLKRLAKNWLSDAAECQEIGDAWIAAGSSVALQVPSATIPAESNFLLNPRHPDSSRLKIGQPQPFRFDPRLARGGRDVPRS